jgi:hypothetical protein
VFLLTDDRVQGESTMRNNIVAALNAAMTGLITVSLALAQSAPRTKVDIRNVVDEVAHNIRVLQANCR